MYKVYNIELVNNALDKMEEWTARSEYENPQMDNYKQYFKKDELNANEIMDDLFPQLKYDVFISHSHKDIDYVRVFKTMLEKDFGLKVFVDTDVWDFADEFLKQLDNDYTKTGDHTYSYKKRNESTKHVHMMLASSLAQIITKSEIVFLFNTKNYSIKKPSAKNSTKSPWIYYEALLTNLLKIDVPDRIKKFNTLIEQKKFRDSEFKAQDKKIEINYDIDFNNLDTVKFQTITKWRTICTMKHIKGKKALDRLYKLIANK